MDTNREKNVVEVEPGKVFVGGLSWDTTKMGLQNHFAQYGEVTDAVIMVDPVSAKPRGFGFVTFKDPLIVHSVCEQPHTLDGKKIDPKPATSRTSGSNFSGRVKKMFIGGVSQETSEEDIRTYFSQFGNVTDVELKYDKATQRMKGFGFVGFDSEDVVEKLTQVRFHTIKGKAVEAKKAEPRTSTSSTAFGAPHQQQSQQQIFGGSVPTAMGPRFPQSTGYPTPSQNYYNSNYQQQQQQGYGSYAPVGYNPAAYGQPSYGTQQPSAAYGQQQQPYAQQQGYGYDTYNPAARQGQEQVASYGQDQGAAFNTAAYTGTGAEQYSQGTAVGYSYNPPAAPYTPNYQDQSTLTASYGQAPQRSQFPPYGGR